jgi:hypothetical protein
MIITMFLAGLWHGASWTFAVWGIAQGFALATYTLIDRRYRRRLPDSLGWLITMLFWLETCVLFRADSFSTAVTLWRAMHGLGATVGSVDPEGLALIALGGLIAILGPSSQSLALDRLRPAWQAAAAAGAAIFLALFTIGSGVEQEFIYFQF